ncbi:MAG: hypothetical protein AB1540_14090 [Bdellovibrionota bacterium]
MRFLAVILFAFVSVQAVASANSDRFEKLQSVLKHFGIAQEPSYAQLTATFDGAQTNEHFTELLQHIDPAKTLARYASWDSKKLVLFQDRDSKTKVDFSLAFKPDGVPKDPSQNIYQLQRIAKTAPRSAPLTGLRVALDPGHMGGRKWDKRTGKYLLIDGKHHLSEGVLTLHTCLLLAKELEALGATVFLTRTTLGPVEDKIDPDRFDLSPHVKQEIRASSDLGWFDALLEKFTMGQRLFRAFDQHPEIRKIRGKNRYAHFNDRVDLAARAVKINSFKPHLTLIIHFDFVGERTKTQRNTNLVRAYIPGNILPHELATRELRAKLVQTLFDYHRWEESRHLSRKLVQNLAEIAGIKKKTSQTDHKAKKVEDGIYARNLALTRLIQEGALSYLEVLHYNHESEFHRLYAQNRRSEHRGIKFDHSSRLHDIVAGLKQGVLDYVGTVEQWPLARLQ